MSYEGLTDFIRHGLRELKPGTTALLFVEDDVEVESSIEHAFRVGFRNVVAFRPDRLSVPARFAAQVIDVAYDLFAEDAVRNAINATIAALPGRWLFPFYNAEYLFFPFCETRTVGEMIGFVTEERRTHIPAFTIDLYAPDLDAAPNGVDRAQAHLDIAGYYAMGRPGPDGHPLERQLDMFGGLRWRYEEFVPENRRRIDRVGLFRAEPGLELRANWTLSNEEMNTYACPWHHSTTSAVCSFRAAKALRTNPDSAHAVHSFMWHNSRPFTWHSQQLMDLGLMEPGQWF